MNRVTRPNSILDITPEQLIPYEQVLLDRDGVLAHNGQPISEEVVNHVNGLISLTGARFKVVTNGKGNTSHIKAPCVYTRFPNIKQKPGVLRGLVEDPRNSVIITDSPTELLVALRTGFDGFYVIDKMNPHPVEAVFRTVLRPIRHPIGHLLGLNVQAS
jgi:hypothetical protein